jgi:putative membrane-bound dehydrogenase-like protein
MPRFVWFAILVGVALFSAWSGQGWAQAPAAGGAKTILFIAGKASHGFGSHEHYAGCKILADTVRAAVPNLRCEVVRGWPTDSELLAQASGIVIYCDGGGGHIVNSHLDEMDSVMKRGTGLVCLHYAVEVPKGEVGDRFKEWLGGYFETHWSVNPHWTAKFEKMPDHPIVRGVSPFEANDEWYFHMRFRPNMEGVTPILSAVAPASTMTRPDGPHSGNPDVRKAVAQGLPQHTAWAFQRPGGGRSFGFTGGHYHWNWGRPEILRLVGNAIAWTAGIEIPSSGLSAPAIPVDQLMQNQDEETPKNFSREATVKQFQLIGATSTASPAAEKGRLLFASPVINSATSRHQVDAEVDIRGVKRLFLVVTDAGDGFSCDWADWVQPTLKGPQGDKALVDLKWTRAESGWGTVRVNANAAGQPLSINGKVVSSGIGTHAPSVIEYELPSGFERFETVCGLDTDGVSQNKGQATSVRFMIYADELPKDLRSMDAKMGDSQRLAENAVAGLTVHPGVQATLAASEPKLKSLTNIDIDHRGRVWACEVVNYRRHNGERPEGDRILILEDADGDGVMDSSKVFYQGRDIDSAMGICVLGNRVIVSAAPYVWVFTDNDGDDKPDKKEAWFTKTGQPQHDHSNHSFLFGPDGKLYWNFGNTGLQLNDPEGKPVYDRWGREINFSGKPYRQGMAFRCNLDGSDMEVLGHNFRNNYELAVDSFGSVWQSDNDDDGNRATRINFVMEFGNYGYTDETNGAGWQAERTNWETEIPSRHWHLNDPGVVPTMLITGAGSPTGITVYEGRMLPEAFWDQVIHCDAGPNVVRAYPAKPDGAGYSATMLNLAVGEVDRWFRPADVCVAPDGSVFVSDWYDPGVGGHRMEDMERGRLFRLAPPKVRYNVPEYDFASPEGAAQALKNPCHSVRFLAWEALMNMGDKAVPAASRLLSNPNPRVRARALWLLGKMPNQAEKPIRQAFRDEESNLRIAAIRLARQLKWPTKSYFPELLQDRQPAVLRELCLALREDTSPEMPGYWSALAERYDGKDRWYLEALGIAAMDRWDACMEAWVAGRKNPWKEKTGRDILWRSRASKTSGWIADLLKDPALPEAEVDRFLRALDFQSSEARESAYRQLLDLASANQ